MSGRDFPGRTAPDKGRLPALQRGLPHMAEQSFDLVIIGGGITGACIAWDASLRGLSVALLEKRDFACATTAASSKLIHGGLRYLRNFEFAVVRDSLRERRIWQSIAPHMVMPLQFILPCATSMQHLALRTGLLLYDLLSFDRNRNVARDKILPGHGALSISETCNREPVLEGAAPAGALSYYDCQMHTPERLALEFIRGAVANGAYAANYAQVLHLIETDGKVTGVHVCDQVSGDEYDISGRLVINATGPWADNIAAEPDRTAAVKLLRSKGIHLITRAVSTRAIAVLAGGAHFFVLPWRGHSLLATTDTPYTDAPDALKVEESDIASLLAKVNAGLPNAKLTRADIVHCYAGLRPLVADPAEPTANSYGASRGFEIFDHGKEENRPGLISALGGKWTTSRHLAEKLVDMAVRRIAKPARPCQTATTALPGGGMENFQIFIEQAKARYTAMDAQLISHLAHMYGTQLDEIIDLIDADPDMGKALAAHLPEIGAQIRYAARFELALTLEDAVFRRTGLCALGHPGNAALESAAAIMARELHWDALECAHQIAVTEARFTANRP